MFSSALVRWSANLAHIHRSLKSFFIRYESSSLNEKIASSTIVHNILGFILFICITTF